MAKTTQHGLYIVESDIDGLALDNTMRMMKEGDGSPSAPLCNMQLIDNLIGSIETAVASKANKALVGQAVIAENEWAGLQDSTPFVCAVTKAMHLDSDATVRLVNDNPILFATYGFQIASATESSITFYATKLPTETVTLSLEVY